MMMYSYTYMNFNNKCFKCFKYIEEKLEMRYERVENTEFLFKYILRKL